MTAVMAACGGAFPTNTISVSITNQSVYKNVIGAPATATYQVANTGLIKDQDAATLETWLLVGTAAEFDVRATLASGTSPSGSALATWLNCATDRTWSQFNGAVDGSTVSGVILVEIRDASSLTVLDNATVTISATSSP